VRVYIGFLDIDVKVYGPDMKVIYEAEREKDGTFIFVANQAGTHRFCFGNTMSTGMYMSMDVCLPVFYNESSFGV
jgi:hypothetical protein